MQQDDLLEIGGKTFGSRLIVGTGKYASMELMQQCHEASGADMVTVALRRMELPDSEQTLLDYIDRDRFTILPNTAGCYDAESRHSHRAAGARGGAVGLHQAGGDRRPEDPVPGRGGPAGGHPCAGQGRLHRHAVHQRRPGDGQEARRTPAPRW